MINSTAKMSIMAGVKIAPTNVRVEYQHFICWITRYFTEISQNSPSTKRTSNLDPCAKLWQRVEGKKRAGWRWGGQDVYDVLWKYRAEGIVLTSSRCAHDESLRIAADTFGRHLIPADRKAICLRASCIMLAQFQGHKLGDSVSSDVLARVKPF